VYKLPKDKLVYGPMQIEARVDQQTEISRELSLWGQRGSRVIRGNLLAIPVSDAFVYVEPIYLVAEQAEQTRPPAQQPQPGTGRPSLRRKPQAGGQPVKSGVAALPELKRVIVALGNRLVMEDNLDRALNRLLETELAIKESKRPAASSQPWAEDSPTSNLGKRALEHYRKAKASLRRGDWADYGRQLDHLEGILKELSELAEK
jgi:uncharacterized membrane protein (UPF0182 family)